MPRRQCGHFQSPVLWEWSHFPQPVGGAGFVSPDQPIPFWFSCSKTKFIIHKPENLCNSPGKAVSSKDSLCSHVSPFQDCSFSTGGGFLWACLLWDVTSKGKARTDTVVMSDSCDPTDFRQEPTRLLCLWGVSRQEHCSGLPFPSPGVEP